MQTLSTAALLFKLRGVLGQPKQEDGDRFSESA
jgi:hypothetical protein